MKFFSLPLIIFLMISQIPLGYSGDTEVLKTFRLSHKSNRNEHIKIEKIVEDKEYYRFYKCKSTNRKEKCRVLGSNKRYPVYLFNNQFNDAGDRCFKNNFKSFALMSTVVLIPFILPSMIKAKNMCGLNNLFNKISDGQTMEMNKKDHYFKNFSQLFKRTKLMLRKMNRVLRQQRKRSL